MKKNIILVLIIGLLFYFNNNFKSKNKIDSKNNYNNYNIEELLVNFNIINDNLYYVTEKENTSTIYLTNLLTNNRTNLGNIEGNCFIEDNYLICDNNDFTVYDLNLNLLYKNSNPQNSTFFPYKDTFLKLKNNNLYLNQKEEVLFRNLEFYGEYKNYYTTKSNTYLLFTNYNTAKSYIYNINTNEYQEISYTTYFKYNSGFCFYNEESLYILDLKENKEYNLSNPLSLDYYFGGTINSNYLYLYNSNNFIEYDIKKEIIKNIPISDYNINNLLKYKDNLYYYFDNNILTISLNEIKDSITLKEYKNNLSKEVEKYAEDLSLKYNLKIYLKEKVIFNNQNFSAELLTNDTTIKNALNAFTPILNKFSPLFFESFNDLTTSNINIYLTGKLNNLENETLTPVAYSLNYDHNYLIVIDITSSNLKETLCHELMHNIEFSLPDENKFSSWSKYNPPSFTYSNSYNIVSPFDYTIEEKNKENIYFVDKYSHTYHEEDRARIFENICAYDTSPLLDYPNLINKAQYLEKEILKYYPSLKDVFKSIETNIPEEKISLN